jgi:hypothetical protein
MSYLMEMYQKSHSCGTPAPSPVPLFLISKPALAFAGADQHCEPGPVGTAPSETGVVLQWFSKSFFVSVILSAAKDLDFTVATLSKYARINNYFRELL